MSDLQYRAYIRVDMSVTGEKVSIEVDMSDGVRKADAITMLETALQALRTDQANEYFLGLSPEGSTAEYEGDEAKKVLGIN